MAMKGGTGFGVVGCGMIADFHASAVQAMKGGHLVAALDTLSPKSAERVGKKFGCAYYTDPKAFLAHPGLEIVAIATPSGAHLEPTLAAARAGKHVICEKPLEITLERCDRMIRECKKAGVTLAGIFPARTGGEVQELKKAIDSGRFGRLTMCDAYIKWWRTQEYYDSGGWRGTWELDGGGALMNQGIHTIDLLQYLAGDVESVFAIADCLAHKRIEVEDVCVAALRFRNGAVGVIEGATAAFPGHSKEVHISGEDGSAFLKDSTFTVWELKKMTAADKRIWKKYGPQPAKGRAYGAADPKHISFQGHQIQFEDMVKAVRNGTDPMVTGPEARKAVEIILAVYRSAQTGRPVRLPLKRTPKLTAIQKSAKKVRKAK